MALNNINLISHILSYCNEIKNTLSRFGDDINIFINDTDYRKSVCMSLLQIGELAGKLTEDYRNSTSEIPWKQIRGLRNLVAHAYGEVDFYEIFDVAHDDINELRSFCVNQIAIFENLSQSSEENDEDDWDDGR